MLDNIARRAMQSHVKASLKKIPKGVKVKTLQTASMGASEMAQRLKDAPVTFNVDKVSDTYSSYLNRPRPRASNIIEDPVEAAKYKSAGQDYYAENASLGGYPFYRDPATGEMTHYLKSNSRLNKQGRLQVKTVKLSERDARTARRQRWESEQTMGPTGRGVFVHHKTPLGLMDRIAAGLSATERRKFFEYVHYNNRWSTLKVGNEATNLVGLRRDRSFHPTHVDVHKLLEMAGLDDAKIDFTGATMEERYGFLDEITPLLDQIDEFIFQQRMSGLYPEARFTSGKLKGQKRFKGFKRPTED